jgi:hypothetical protein
MRVGFTVALRVHRASELHSTMFVFGGSADHDGGGFTLNSPERRFEV